jgi:signal transduction histidine kinase
MPGPWRDEDLCLRRLADEQAALRRVATLVARGVKPDELFSAVSEEVARLFGAEAAIARFEADGSAMVVVGLTKGIPVVTVGTRWKLEDFLASTTVYRTGRPARNDHGGHADASGAVAASLRQMDFVSTVAAPIVVEGGVWGVMTVSDKCKRLPSDTEERAARFTDLLATAVANAESRAELNDLVAEQAALRQVAMLVARGVSPAEMFKVVSDEVARLFGAEAGVGRFDPDGSKLVVVGLSEGVRGLSVGTCWPLDGFLASAEVQRTGRPARSPRSRWQNASGPTADALRESGLVASISAPIAVEGRPWGVIAVAETRTRLPPDAEERLEKFTDLVATAIANAESRRAVDDLANEQAALRRVATRVARGAAPSEVFAMVSQEAGQLFGSDMTAIVRYEPGGAGFVVVGLTPGVPAEIPLGTRWPLDDYLASAAVYRTGRPARSDHAGHRGASGPLADSFRRMGPLSTVATPIVVQGKLWGAMTVSTDRAPLPTDTEERAAKFTELVATAIANADSREDLAASEARAHELAGEQAALRRVATLVAEGARADELFAAVAEEVADVLDIPVVGLHRFESDGTFTMMGIAGETGFTVGSRWPVEDAGLAGMLRATGRPARKEDYTTMPGPLGTAVRDDRMVATVGVPIVVEGGIWGFIVGAARPGKPIPPDSEDRLMRFTELVATAIANSQARESLARLAEEQAALRRVATLVAHGVSPAELFSAVSDEVGRLFRAEATVARYEPGGSAAIVVGQTAGIPVVGVGDRWELDDLMATSTVYRTGQSARNDWTGLENVAGRTGERLRTLNFTSTVAAPVVVEDELWGVIAVSHQHQRLPPDTEERVERFTELLATAIANADSREELAASRARIVAAADDARRRIERDLHDGAQQRLLTLAVALRRAEAKIPDGLDTLRAEVTRVTEGLRTAVEELRELSRGIHPSVLTANGLPPALKALARRSTVRVRLDVEFDQRLPDHVEVAAYYTVSEALTNASKHANATQGWVSLRVEDDLLHLSIRDDGVGGADARRGSGLTGLTDRIEALGGKIKIESPPGNGTSIDVEIPIAPAFVRDSETYEQAAPAPMPAPPA